MSAAELPKKQSQNIGCYNVSECLSRVGDHMELRVPRTNPTLTTCSFRFLNRITTQVNKDLAFKTYSMTGNPTAALHNTCLVLSAVL